MLRNPRIMLLALAVVLVLANVWLVAFTLPRLLPTPPQPNPNGYGDFVKAAGLLTGGTRARLIRLQVLFLPLQAGRSGPGDEPDLASAVLHFPLLRGVVEFDVAGSGDFKPTEFMQRESLGPKTIGGSIEFE
jgi:hypothetical protein